MYRPYLFPDVANGAYYLGGGGGGAYIKTRGTFSGVGLLGKITILISVLVSALIQCVWTKISVTVFILLCSPLHVFLIVISTLFVVGLAIISLKYHALLIVNGAKTSIVK